jgi:hypothetical protein
MKKIHKIYIAGPLTPRGMRKDTDNPAIEYLFNVNDMIDVSIQLIKCGLVPFTPGIDFPYFLHPSAKKVLTAEKIYELSKTWMECCDALLVLPHFENSTGVLAELQRANELGMPIFHGIGPILEHNKKVEDETIRATE